MFFFFFFNDTATTEIYTLSPTRRSSDLYATGLDRAVIEAAGRMAQTIRGGGDGGS